MPVYTYECEECGVRFDARQKFSDAPIAVCPECGGHTHRVPQPVGIVFKGSGWYSTDSRGRNNLAVPPAKSESDTGDKKSAKSDAPSSGESGASSAKPDTKSSD
ncbi:MAG: hypothetical protein GX613_09785 [Chloroflexi bacterium]|nr:hypothetical protein [Chloroflexota bacterium]